MTGLAIAITLVAGGLVFAGGYIFGAKAGKQARDVLLSEMQRVTEQRAQAVAEAESRLREIQQLRESKDSSQGDAQIATLHSTLDQLAAQLEQRSQDLERALSGTVNTLATSVTSRDKQESARQQALATQLETLRAKVLDRSDVEDLLRPLREGRAASAQLESRVQHILEPLARTQSIQRTLEEIAKVQRNRSDITELLSTVKERCGLTGCVLADATGLPVAAAEGSSEVDLMAGLSSFFHRLAERTRAGGQPAPNAFLARDEENQLVLARLIRLEGENYALMATLQGTGIEPGTLDPLVPAIRSALNTEPWEEQVDAKRA